ncbi:DUF5333 domain-containing protein [Pseudoroseicyclus aestuarii]|uniref:DUF5333 domain-containing protein n=1 Tax=Pseudoroseicyclus aestuarii TaxID=1795041 RepID=A0A318SV24_9RHOB|nr:DUF5333 domain-containing protein [Pseudoroseicyclus aestuarii]PYE84146.1 hypothetical protein DFP88_103513 [Pseudoroseicyclus aestuarii]
MPLPRAARTLGLIFGFAIVAGATAALPALRENDRIREGLIDAAIAYEIGDNCGTLSARLFDGLFFLNGLRNHALDLGYSRAQVDAFIDNDAEKDRLEELARQRFTRLGGTEGDEASYCAVGRAEIARGSQIGRLLR